MTIAQEKILNGIKYFVTNTNNVGRTKLFKLLYFWDFIHFKRHGLSVTGFEYYTYPFGPVPKKLYDEITKDDLPRYLGENLSIIEITEENDEYRQFKINLKNSKIDFDCFSPNEKRILEEVAYIFRDATAKQMTEITHLHNTPWSKTSKDGEVVLIDYFLAFDEKETILDREEIEERFSLQKDMIADGRY